MEPFPCLATAKELRKAAKCCFVSEDSERMRWFYAAMLSRLLAGGRIQAASQSFDLLRAQLCRIEVAGRLRYDVETAADLIWASVNSAAMFFATAGVREANPPTEEVLDRLRSSALESILRRD